MTKNLALVASVPLRLTRALAVNAVLNDSVPGAVIASYGDPDRLSPVPAGSCWFEGNRLTVRTATHDVRVQASKILLAQVFMLCDGTRTVNEVLEKLPKRILRDEFRQFIEFLLAQGALIDSALVTAHASRYAFQDTPFGMIAGPAITEQIRSRFTWNRDAFAVAFPSDVHGVIAAPLQDLFEARVSTRTFGDRAITRRTLLALLWSIAGVVRVKHQRNGYDSPQRTIASGGALHLIKVFVVLQRRIGKYEPGVYRIHYPDERAVALELVGNGYSLLPRAFVRPWELTYATGAIFLAADPRVAAMRYSNRALQYLFMEAGAALHNGGLSAPKLGLGFATIGGYYEKAAVKLCHLADELILGAAIFGPAPTQEQLNNVHRSPELDFAWVEGDSEKFSLPFHLARAKVKGPEGDRSDSWGRDADPWLAMRKASAEAIEREGLREPRNLEFGAFAELKNAQDPTRFANYSAAQYADRKFPFSRFLANEPYLWAAGVDAVTGLPVRVLAELVFSRSSLSSFGPLHPRPFTQVTTSGCAAGRSAEEAGLNAMLELIERDAFMRHWLAQTAGTVIRPGRLSGDIRGRMHKLKQAGCDVVVQRLHCSWAHVCMFSARHEALHFATMGTSANADFDNAARDALSELETRVYAWMHGHQPKIKNPLKVNSPLHHFDLYGSKRYFRRADGVLFPDGDPVRVKLVPMQCRSLNQLIDVFAAKSIHPLLVDMTPERCYVDQGRTKLSVVKTLIPGLLPIAFGYHIEPEGMVARVHPGARFPHPFP